MKPELKKACETITDYMDRPKIKRYLISSDGGDSYSLDFGSPVDASEHLDRMQSSGYCLEYEIVEKKLIYWDYATSLDSIIPVLEKAELQIHNTAFYGDNWLIVLDWIDREKNKIRKQDWVNGSTLQEAACLAAAKAIESLND